MAYLLAIWSAILLLLLQDGEAFTKQESKLCLLSMIFRHGDRSPDFYEIKAAVGMARTSTAPRIGNGQLTNQGKRRLFNNGDMFRNEYYQFLGPEYVFGNAISYVTSIPRTGTSALAFLAGLFPPSKYNQWDSSNCTGDNGFQLTRETDLPEIWDPIPYGYDSQIEREMVGYYNCSAYWTEFNRVFQLPEFKEKYIELYKHVSEQTGITISSPLEMFLILSFLKGENNLGIPYPDWALQDWEDLSKFGDFFFRTSLYNDKLKQLAGGKMVKRIVNNMIAKSENRLTPENRKIIIYSGHDISVAAVYAALGGHNGFVDQWGNPAPVNCPNYGATLIIELHEILISGTFAVKILYHNYKSAAPQLLKLVGCDVLCPLERLMELTGSKTTAPPPPNQDQCN